MLAWTGLAVLFTGLCSLYFLLQPPRSLASTQLAGQGSRAESADGTRAPAAVKDGFSTEESVPRHQAVELNLPCDGKTALDSNVAQVRLTGAPCENPKEEFASSSIKNEANGFSATVFHPTVRTFTTDYISLSPGLNAIKIQHVFKKGRKEDRTYVIERAR